MQPEAATASKPTVLESALRRDRATLLSLIFGITTLAWVYMAREAAAMYATGSCRCAGMAMSGPDTAPWAAATLVPLFLMWAEMMVAMMLPSAAPMILMFASVNRKRREQERPFVPATFFIFGYLLIWAAFSLAAAGAQWVLHGKAMLSPMMTATAPALAGVLLIAAGLFQWTRFKDSCLTHCRSPLTFLLTEWRNGKSGALRMGLKHGLYCTGCCWILMAQLFVFGVMNLWWIGALTMLVLVEKIAPRGLLIGRATGVCLLLWGFRVLLASHS